MARLLAKDGTQLRWGAAIGWALSWGVGAAIGIAAGAWLTVVGEAGAPGVESLDPTSDLVMLPLAALVVVSLVHLAVQAGAAKVRGMRSGGHTR